MEITKDLLGPPPIVGLQVLLNANRAPKCCGDVPAEIHPGKGPHAGQLVCSKCGGHRGWVSKDTYGWLLDVVARFGWPDVPVAIRDRAETSQS